MKSAGAMVLIVTLALLLRSTALTALAARGVVLDVLAAATVLWALRHGASWGTSFGFVLGLAADLDAAHWIGRHALALSLIGYIVGRLSRTLVRDSYRTLMVLLVAATAVHLGLVSIFELRGGAAWTYLLTRVALAAAATAPAVTLLVAVLRRIGGRPLFGHAAIEPHPTG